MGAWVAMISAGEAATQYFSREVAVVGGQAVQVVARECVVFFLGVQYEIHRA